ncbi:MAG: hypothetical protein OXF06_00970 [Bacteroidetes bacterium]|nr:hypothetical protein [Bacteroidota bacterium]
MSSLSLFVSAIASFVCVEACWQATIISAIKRRAMVVRAFRVMLALLRW